MKCRSKNTARARPLQIDSVLRLNDTHPIMMDVFAAIHIHYSQDNLIIPDNELWKLHPIKIQSLLQLRPPVAVCPFF